MARGVKGEQTEAALKEAGRVVLARKGYFKTTIADITAEAGKANGSFHHYFANKDELLLALIADGGAARLCARIEPQEHASGMQTWVGMRAHVREFWRMMHERRAEIVATFQAAMASDDFARRWRDAGEANIGQIAEHLREAQDHGCLSGQDPRFVATALESMLMYFCMAWSSPAWRPLGLQQDDEQAIDALTTLALGAIGAPLPNREQER